MQKNKIEFTFQCHYIDNDELLFAITTTKGNDVTIEGNGDNHHCITFVKEL